MARPRKRNYILAVLGLSAAGVFLIAGPEFLRDFSSPQVYDAGAVISGEQASVIIAEEEKTKHLPTPEPVRAIYMTSWVAGTSGWRDDLVKLIEDSELNSIVIDVKDYSGRIAFEVRDPELKKWGAQEIRVDDFNDFISELHEKNIYAIARISVFQDPHMTHVRPELAVKNSAGGIWKDRKGLSWIDPAAREYWDYIVRIARETERLGFDELNFDYIRFPSDGNMQDVRYDHLDPQVARRDSLLEFFAYLDNKLSDLEIPISADLFGMVTTNYDDLNIGQVLEYAVPYFDYISPMVYPSHYPPKFMGFANPAAHPYEVVKDAMTTARDRLIAATSSPSKLRPWIQDFDLGADYDAMMVKKQMQAVYDSGLTGWMSWDPANKYTREAYYPQ